MKLHTSLQKLPLLALLSILPCSFPLPLCAQEVGEEEKKEAALLYESGAAAFLGKNYGKAILEYNKGYAVYPNGAFLVQLARSHGKLDEFAKAREFAIRAENDPTTPERLRQDNLERIGVFTAQDSETIARKIVESLKVNAPGAPPKTASDGIGPFGWTGLALGVVGLGTLGGSLYFNQQVSDYDDGNSDLTYDEVRDAHTTGRIMLGVGAAVSVIGFGMFLYALGTRSSDESALFYLAPTQEGGLAGVSWRW